VLFHNNVYLDCSSLEVYGHDGHTYFFLDNKMSIVDAHKKCFESHAIVAPFLDDIATNAIKIKGKNLFVTHPGNDTCLGIILPKHKQALY